MVPNLPAQRVRSGASQFLQLESLDGWRWDEPFAPSCASGELAQGEPAGPGWGQCLCPVSQPGAPMLSEHLTLSDER